LRLDELGLNLNGVSQIPGLAQFTHIFLRSSDVLTGDAFQFFTKAQFQPKDWMKWSSEES
jgi:hypothetical protein